jgi:outer membrane protein OmpA-like peptidoglycan-associated protein
MKTIRPLIAMAMLAVALVSITACGAGGGSATAAGCDIPTGGETEAPTVAVLATPRGAKSAGGDGTLNAVIEGASELDAQVMVEPVRAADQAKAPKAIETRLVAEGPNELMRKTNLDCKTQKVTGAVTRISKEGPKAGRPDLISALVALNDQVEAAAAGAPLVVILGGAETTTKVGTGEVLDLTRELPQKSPAQAINELARAGLNFDCADWRVAIVGGRPGSASAVEQRRLRGFWSLYFHHCGGALVAFSPVLDTLPAGTEAVAGPDYREIPIKIERSSRRVVATLSGTVLFQTESSHLRPAAAASLRRLLTVVDGAHGPIKIAGYTDSTGSRAVNVPLSRARAEAVASWLIAQGGVDRGRIAARGMGEREPVADNRTAAGRATNRRVVVTVERR